MKRKVNGLAAVGIIFRRANPAQQFLEVKDDGHPICHARRKLCFIGGNWIGEHAKADKCPYDTFCRELDEELSFDRPMRNSLEYALLGVSAQETFEPTPEPAIRAASCDQEALLYLKRVIAALAFPFGDYINTVPKAALDAADPQNKREGFNGLASYWQVSLNEEDWQLLESLQKKFNNLSNESITLITSLEEILARRMEAAFAHDRVLQKFFLSHKLTAAWNMPMVPGLNSEAIGPPLRDYKEYLAKYDVARHPQ